MKTLAKARFVNYDHNCSFIVLATVITIVNYDRHLFIVQATGKGFFSKDQVATSKLPPRKKWPPYTVELRVNEYVKKYAQPWEESFMLNTLKEEPSSKKI